MYGYREIALLDLEDATFSFEHKRYRSSAFFYHQSAENSAKALLEKKYPQHEQLKSHAVHKILEAYDEVHMTSDLGDKGRYLNDFCFINFHPNDTYVVVSESQVRKAKNFAEDLEIYFKQELEILASLSSNITLDIESLPPLNLT